MFPAPRKDVKIVILVRDFYRLWLRRAFGGIRWGHGLARSRQGLLVNSDDRL